jgi:hypothetical protein
LDQSSTSTPGTITQSDVATIRSTTYAPASGLTYVWTEGQAATTTTTKYKSNSSFNLFYDIPTGYDAWDTSNTQYLESKPLLQGQAIQGVAPASFNNANTGYQLEYIQLTQVDPLTTTRRWTTGGGFLRKKTYHIEQNVVQGVKDYYTSQLKADIPITVGFITPVANASQAAGSLTFTSQGIPPTDNASKAGGSLTITSQGNVTLLKGLNNVSNVSIVTGIGKDITLRPLFVNSNSALINLSAGGNIDLQVGALSLGEQGP